MFGTSGDAIVVNQAYKTFGSTDFPLRERLAGLPLRGDKLYRPGNARPRVVAVDHVSFRVPQGQIFGILGPGRAGKSTLIRMLATQLLPDGGEILIFGFDVARQPVQVQRLINHLAEDASFYKQLSALDNLVYKARGFGMEEAQARSQSEEILEGLGMDGDSLLKPMESLSPPLQHLTAIAGSILSWPRLLLLDEPTADLEPDAKLRVQNFLSELRDRFGMTILITTQDSSEAHELCDQVALLEQGRIIGIEKSESLREWSK